MKKSVFLESCGVKKKYLKGGAQNFFSHPLRIFIRENTILDPLGTSFEGSVDHIGSPPHEKSSQEQTQQYQTIFEMGGENFFEAPTPVFQ